MFLKNKSARPITINDGKKSHLIKCGTGEAVEVPDACEKLGFVSALIESGDLVKVEKSKAKY